MKKVVHFVEAFGGGILTYLQDLTSKMTDQMDIYIVYNTREVTPKNFEDLFDQRIHFIRISELNRSLNIKNLSISRKKFKKVIYEIMPDIVHLHSSIAGFIGRSIKYPPRTKVFYTPHGYAFLADNSTIKSKIYKVAEKILGYKNATTIACSQSEYQVGQKLTKKIVEINNFVSPSYLDQFKKDSTNYDNSFFTIGRIDIQKNPRLFNEIALRTPERDFYWFGDGPLRSVLNAPNIKIMGWMAHDEMLSKIKPFKNFILTSEYEGLPIALLEAMYLEKLCFVTDVPGNQDVITDGINGIYLKDSLKHCYDRQALIQQAVFDVLTKYNLEQQAQKYLAIYTRN